jgi:glycine hydroxymethyltransferase
MKETEMRQVARWMVEVLAAPEDQAIINRVRGAVAELCKSFPTPHEHA